MENMNDNLTNLFVEKFSIAHSKEAYIEILSIPREKTLQEISSCHVKGGSETTTYWICIFYMLVSTTIFSKSKPKSFSNLEKRI